MDIKHIMKDHAYQNIPLTYEEAYQLGLFALEGCDGDVRTQIQSISALSALHTRFTYAWHWKKSAEERHRHRLPKNAAEQIAGVCAAIFEHDIAISPAGYLRPNVPYAMDNCGMGGDLIITANISTIAAFIAAAAGIHMCKHGSPANADGGRHGSSDFISMLGINTMASKTETERCIEKECFGYTEALDLQYKRIHRQTHSIAMLPHMNDIIGPITNPLLPQIMTRRILGVSHLISPRTVAEAYQILNAQGITSLVHGIFLRGFADNRHYAGMDEASICPGGTQIAELSGSDIREYYLQARDFGIKPVPVSSISPDGISKGDFSLKILKREIKGPPLQMILANAALLFYLAGHSKKLPACYSIAEEIQKSGLAYQKALSIRERLPQCTR